MVPYLFEFGSDYAEGYARELDQFTKIRGEESFPEMFSAKQEATAKADDAIKKLRSAWM